MTMHNSTYPSGAAKFQSDSDSFGGFIHTSNDYPLGTNVVASPDTPSNQLNVKNNQQNFFNKNRNQYLQQQQLPPISMPVPKTGRSQKMRSISSSNNHHMNSSKSNFMPSITSGSLGHHRNNLMFSDDLDTIEFCLPNDVSNSSSGDITHGLSNELLLARGQNFNSNCSDESFFERRRRSHSRRNNHKIEIEQQVKWTHKNIAATMERFEPTHHQHSSSSTSSLEYGFGANPINQSLTTALNHSQHQQIYPIPSSSFQGVACATAPYNHVYSYAYYEPGEAKCHTNVPQKDLSNDSNTANMIMTHSTPMGAGAISKSPTRHSIRALLAKSFRYRSNNEQSTSSSPCTDDKHNYTTRYGTTENLYEEVNEQKMRKVLSDNRIAVASVKEELRRVQHNHFRVLDELNLSLEALIMPETPPDISPNHTEDVVINAEPINIATTGTVTVNSITSLSLASESVASSSSQKPRRGGLLGGASSLSSTVCSSEKHTMSSQHSLENLSSTLNSIELKDHAHNACVNPEFDEGDLDSGFSGSGSSSGASYNESLRYYKTSSSHQHQNQNQNHQQHTVLNSHHHNSFQQKLLQQQNQQQQQHILQNIALPLHTRSCRSSTASGSSISKNSATSSDEHSIVMMLRDGPLAGQIGPISLHTRENSLFDESLPFHFTQYCSNNLQRSSTRRSVSSSASCTTVNQNAASSPLFATSTISEVSTGAKPKKSFWKLKP